LKKEALDYTLWITRLEEDVDLSKADNRMNDLRYLEPREFKIIFPVKET